VIGDETLRQVEKIEAGARYFRTTKPRNSVDTLLRTVQQHHVQLSVMADTKASILITVSSIVATIALSRANEARLRPALLTLAAACLVALILAIVAVLPTFSKKRGSRNLLFFGHFSSMSEDEFLHAVEQIVATDDLLYEAAARDIYGLGKYLHQKKYRYLRFAYMALIAGLLLAMLVETYVVIW